LGVENPDREGDSFGGGGVISSEHSNGETSLFGFEDGGSRLRSRRIAAKKNRKPDQFLVVGKIGKAERSETH